METITPAVKNSAPTPTSVTKAARSNNQGLIVTSCFSQTWLRSLQQVGRGEVTLWTATRQRLSGTDYRGVAGGVCVRVDADECFLDVVQVALGSLILHSLDGGGDCLRACLTAGGGGRKRTYRAAKHGAGGDGREKRLDRDLHVLPPGSLATAKYASSCALSASAYVGQ